MKSLQMFFFFLPLVTFGQANILNAKSPDEIGIANAFDEVESDVSPLAYGYISDKDVLFSKTIWEEINLDERVNFPMYYPIDTLVVGNERRPLIHFLLKSAMDGEFDVYEKDNFKEVMPIVNIQKKLIYRSIYENVEGIGMDRIKYEAGTIRKFLIQKGIDLGEYSDIDETDLNSEEYSIYNEYLVNLIFENNLLERSEYSLEEFNYSFVSKYRIKGVWYFDKRQSDLRYRPIAIAPVIITPRSKNRIDNAEQGVVIEPDYIELFWVFYPDARKILHEGLAFNDKNTSKPITFDHLINSRRFSAYIYKEDNVYEDRDINDYISKNALMQLLESQRIKEKIRNLEQDMWSY